MKFTSLECSFLSLKTQLLGDLEETSPDLPLQLLIVPVILPSERVACQSSSRLGPPGEQGFLSWALALGTPSATQVASEEVGTMGSCPIFFPQSGQSPGVC